MKKTKLLKCLLPLFGVSALIVVPILSTACANGVINNQTQSANETLVDEASSSASGSSTQTGSTSTSVIDKYYESKKTENLNILKNIKWFYKNPHSESNILDDKNQIKLDLSPSNLDWAISGVYDLDSGKNIITNMQNGSATLGFYPYVKLGKNQYTSFNTVSTVTSDASSSSSSSSFSSSSTSTTTTITNQWFLPNENLLLKGKILTMDYFVPKVTLYTEPSLEKDPTTLLEKVDNYKLVINKLTLSDSTTEFPNGDPRTIATLEVPKSTSKINEVDWNKVKTETPSLQILDINRPSPKSVEGLLNEYQNVVTSTTSTGIKRVKDYLTQVKNDDSAKYRNQFTSILEKFNIFGTINANSVADLTEYLKFEDPDIFTTIIRVLDALFNFDKEENKLFTTFKNIYASLDAVTDAEVAFVAEQETPTTTPKATDVANNIKLIVDKMAEYYLSFASDLYDLVSNCVAPGWLLSPSIIESQK